MVVLCAHYIGSWLGLIAKTVRPYIRPYIDWFEYLKSWLKKAIRCTTKYIQSYRIVTCLAAAIHYSIYYLIWSPIHATVDLVRGCSMEFLKPGLKRERLHREQLWRISASRRVYSTSWRGLPFSSMNLLWFCGSLQKLPPWNVHHASP